LFSYIINVLYLPAIQHGIMQFSVKLGFN